MRKTEIALPELGFIAGTRALLGAGIALLLSSRIPPDKRRKVGMGLAGLGVATTIPIALRMFHRLHA